MRTINSYTILCVLLISSSAHAQAIDPDNKFAWGENIGFLNFADAGDPPGSAGVFANPDHLEGFIWGENIGWVHVGAGNGPYDNTTGLDFGVNISTRTGALSGYAWGENVGWINFNGGAMATPPNPARIEDGRFRGYAWGENIGWINLDDDTIYVGLNNCPADLNGDGMLNFFDVSAFLGAYNAMDPAADFTGDGLFNFFDVSAFLIAFNSGCP
ncbi:MAG: hypothetical protein KDA29_10860 [Phycisphaerales bacterium]|nr:hypothetical protein [Phycisphaerales bacterium]